MLQICTLIVILLFLILSIQEKVINGAKNKQDDVFKGAQIVKCNNRTISRSEDLMQLLIPMGTDKRLPETPPELKKYCNLAMKSIPFIMGVFKHCTTQFAKMMAKVMFFPVRKQMDNVCKSGKISRTAQEFMIAGKCGNLAKQPLSECNNNFIDAIHGVMLAPVKSRIYMMCCHLNAYRVCIREATEETVGCTRHTIDWAERLVLKAMGGSIDLVCGEYFEESDKCVKLIDQTPNPQLSKSYKRPKTMVQPMIKLMESFPDLDSKN